MKALLAATLMLVAAPIWAAPGVSNALGYPTLSINDISVIEGNGPGITATITDGQGVCTIIDDDGGPGDIVVSELFHGFRELEDLAGVGGAANSDYYVLAQMPASSYEVLVDSTSGDIGPTLDVQRIGPGGSVLQSSLPT